MFTLYSEDHPVRSKLTALFTHEDDAIGEMYVFFPDDPKTGIQTIRTYCQRMQDEKITRAIIVGQTDLTPSAKQVSQF